MRRDTFVHLFGAVCILLTALFLPTALTSVEGQSAEPTAGPGIPRDAYYVRQVSGAGFEAQAAIAQPPATLRNAFLKGGIALVFGCYDDSAPNLREFDAELPLIAAAGAGNVRLTCSIGTFEQGTSGQLNEARYQDLRSFINLAWSYGLTTTVDFHIFRTREPGQDNWSDNYQWHVGNAALENRAISVVTEAARRLSQDIPVDRFAIQPANEPIDQPTWYDYQRRMFNSVRAACPQCTIAVMGRDWQGIEESVYRLDLSAFSGSIYVDFHLYEPIGLTHCEYPGMANNCPNKQYPGVNNTWRDNTGWFQEQGIPVGYFDRNTLFQLIREGDQWADAHGVFAILGEMGTTAALNEEVRARYLGDIASIARELGIGFTAYEWHHNFGIKQHPRVVSALFSGAAPVTPAPTTIVPTSPPSTAVPTSVATAVSTPTQIPGQPPASIDYNEVIRLAQVLGQRVAEADNARAAAVSAQSAVEEAIEAIRNYLASFSS